MEKGIPVPPIKYHPGSYPNAKHSPWFAYLQALEPGDSFVVTKSETQSIMLSARKAGVKITWSVQQDQQVRVWRVRPEDMPVKPRRQWVKETKKQVPFPPEETPACSPAPPESADPMWLL